MRIAMAVVVLLLAALYCTSGAQKEGRPSGVVSYGQQIHEIVCDGKDFACWTSEGKLHIELYKR